MEKGQKETIECQTAKLNAGLRAWKQAAEKYGVSTEQALECGEVLEARLSEAFDLGMKVELEVDSGSFVSPVESYVQRWHDTRIVFLLHGVAGSDKLERRKLAICLITGRGGVALTVKNQGTLLALGLEDVEELRCVWPTP